MLVSSIATWGMVESCGVSKLDNKDGLLVEPQNVDAMVDAIIKLKSDEALRNKIVVNARSKVENFSWEAVKPKWNALL